MSSFIDFEGEHDMRNSPSSTLRERTTCVILAFSGAKKKRVKLQERARPVNSFAGRGFQLLIE